MNCLLSSPKSNPLGQIRGGPYCSLCSTAPPPRVGAFSRDEVDVGFWACWIVDCLEAVESG